MKSNKDAFIVIVIVLYLLFVLLYNILDIILLYRCVYSFILQ